MAAEAQGAWRRLRQSLVNFLFPPVCAACRRPGALLCSQCRVNVVWLHEPVCTTCGRPVPAGTPHCLNCRRNPLPVHQVRAATLYEEPVAPLIRRMKYQGVYALAEPLSELMALAWPRWQTPLELVLPVPLHPEREQKRGYNQAELLVQHLCRRLGWTTASGGLQRIRHTRPQVELNGRERQNNVIGAFTADPAVVSGKVIMLIDDVCTTGATLGAAADALLAAGARSVSGYCIARVTDTDRPPT